MVGGLWSMAGRCGVIGYTCHKLGRRAAPGPWGAMIEGFSFWVGVGLLLFNWDPLFYFGGYSFACWGSLRVGRQGGDFVLSWLWFEGLMGSSPDSSSSWVHSGVWALISSWLPHEGLVGPSLGFFGNGKLAPVGVFRIRHMPYV